MTKYTDLGPGDIGAELDDDTVEQPIEYLTDEEFIAEVWAKLADNSPAIDEFILNLRKDPTLSNHRWLPSLQEIKKAVIKVRDEDYRK